MDCRDAPYEAVGAFRPHVYLWIAVDTASCGARPNSDGGGSVSCHLLRTARCHDAANCCMGLEATRSMAGPSLNSYLGWDGLCDLAGKFHPQHHPLAESRLLHPRWPTRTARFSAF